MTPRRSQDPPPPRPAHYDHPKECECAPCQRDLLGALCWAMRAAATVAIENGMSEERFARLARVCWRWERGGEIPKRLDGVGDDGGGERR